MPKYDRELIARMLETPSVFEDASRREQARLLREAENLEADARTVVREVPEASEPDQALLISMATCLNHGFGLLPQGRQESLLRDMRKLWDEVMGRGYYRPDRRQLYMDMLSAASGEKGVG